jgi:hypothetical protein
MIERLQTGYILCRPTIFSLRNMLNEMEAIGWDPLQPIEVKQMSNAPELFHVKAVEEWLGAPITPNEGEAK